MTKLMNVEFVPAEVIVTDMLAAANVLNPSMKRVPNWKYPKSRS